MNKILEEHEALETYQDIKHISFDLWKTLIKSSPTFQATHLDLMERDFNLLKKTRQQLHVIMQETKEFCDTEADNFGRDYGTYYLRERILMQTMGGCTPDLFDTYYTKRETLFLAHLPLLYDNSIYPILQTLKNKGYTMNILSNTGLTGGSTLKKMLQLQNIDQFFDFTLFSDELGAAKPNKHVFDHVYLQASLLHGETLEKHNILHVGDNQKADEAGAQASGMQSMLIHTDTTPFSILQYLP